MQKDETLLLIYFDYLIVREKIVKNMSAGRETNGTTDKRNRTCIF